MSVPSHTPSFRMLIPELVEVADADVLVLAMSRVAVAIVGVIRAFMGMGFVVLVCDWLGASRAARLVPNGSVLDGTGRRGGAWTFVVLDHLIKTIVTGHVAELLEISGVF